MQLTFLEAAVPLTKTYEKTSDGISKTPYPHVYEVTSHRESVKDLKGFHAALTKHAALNHCLLKGNVTRDLVKESRAGSTDSNAPTDFIVFDIDGLPVKSVEDFLTAIGLADVSYIVQYSASHGITSKDLRAHVFMLLDKPAPAPLVKQWLVQLNHQVDLLRNAMGLTKTGNALSWPLDISACQNDKLIYIAAPVLKGIKDPLGKTPRIALVAKSKASVVLPHPVNSTAKNRELTVKRIEEIREQAGLPKRKTTFKMHGSMEVLVKPDVCVVTEMKQERGFIYFNLNGGDSWAYYHPENNPDYIFNFKGEPVYLTKELLPDYWEELHQRTNRVDSRGVLKLAFLNPKDDKYWRGTYDTNTDELKLESTASSRALIDYTKANGIPLFDGIIPEFEMYFDPHDNVRVDLQNSVINTFAPSQYMKAQARKVKAIPKTIRKVIYHVVGGEQEVFDRFINWLAFALQERDRAETAWIFHGTQGTGKGILKNKILRPLFGHEHVALPRMKELEKEFNVFIDKSLLIIVDEVETNALQNEKGVIADLKLYITDEMVPLRRMHRTAQKVRNYSSWIFFSNKSVPVSVDRDDRRFNVGKYQPNKLQITDQEVAGIERELQDFHDFLLYYQVDPTKVREPLMSQDRQELMDMAESSVDTVANALINGSMEFFVDQLPTSDKYASNALAFNKVQDYKDVLVELISRTDRNTGICKIARDELRAIFEYTVGKMPESPNKFTSLLKHHRIIMDKVWLGKTVNGIEVKWRDVSKFRAFESNIAPAAAAPVKKLMKVK